MTPYRKRSCSITRRLAEDLQIRNMADTTIDAYTYHVRHFYDFIKKPLWQDYQIAHKRAARALESNFL